MFYKSKKTDNIVISRPMQKLPSHFYNKEHLVWHVCAADVWAFPASFVTTVTSVVYSQIRDLKVKIDIQYVIMA